MTPMIPITKRKAYVCREELSVDNDSLDVIQILVMLQSLPVSFISGACKSLPSERVQPFQRGSQF